MDLEDRSDKAFPLSRGGLRLNSEPQYMDRAGRGDTDLATTPQASVSKAQPNWTDPKSFAEDIWPHVKRIANKLNVAPEGILAQVALETGWGAHVPTRADGNSSNNLFGIKAGSNWSGDSVAKPTLEFEGGVPRQEVAKFRAYDNLADTFDDYSNLLAENPRYAAVSSNGEDVDGFANALQASGYATDPNYADKIRNVLQGKTMQTFLGGL
jgi:flagellar protein FlgJ